MDQERLRRYHEYTRSSGVIRGLYFLARGLLTPFFLAYFRLSRIGRDHAPPRGALIVAANHRSFLDPFVIATGLPWRRPLHFVAKSELFERRWQGWLLNRLGAYPVRRGESDQDTLDTSRQILERGGAIVIFPEGTRIRRGSLGMPKKGAGRLALETGAAVLPVAVHGTENCRNGWRILPAKVKVRMGRPMTFPRADSPSPALADTLSARIWQNITLQWEWLGGLPPMRKAAVIGAGSWGTAVAILLARGGLEVQLGARTREHADAIVNSDENERYLPGVRMPEGVTVRRSADIELAGVDLVCLAVPSASLPAAVGAIGDRIGDRSAILLLSKGLVPPMAAQPSEYVAERIKTRAIASLGGPAHAREAEAGNAALVLASYDENILRQIGDVFDKAGLVCERTDDVLGVEMAGAAKNAAALAAAAAEPQGLNAAGIAAAEIWRECVECALGQGAHLETFTGLAGVGDLTATVLAPGSRNRRAGELLGQGMPADQIPGHIGQASEALDSVPMIAKAVTEAGVEAPALAGLTALIEGRIDVDEWLARIRKAEQDRQAERDRQAA